MMKAKNLTTALIASAMSIMTASAQNTYEELEQLTVNEQVTTVITATEPIRFVDISTNDVAGDHPIGNTLRLKPKDGIHSDGDVIGIVTIVTERYRAQYALIYTTRMTEAVTDKTIQHHEQVPYANPALTLSTEEIYSYARKIWNSPAHYRNVKARQHRMTMRLNNIYAVGDYFFIDFSVENRTNLRFTIDELRLKLSDKKITRATNAQTVELKPELILEPATSFRRGYRNVVVIRKLTFPNSKVLTIELSERQISGRAISINIDYEDVLSADSFNNILLEEK